MALLFAIILWLSLIIITLVALGLVIPVLIKVHLTTSPQFTYRVEIRAVAGLIPRLTMARGPRKDPVAKPDQRTAKPKQRRTRRPKRAQGSLALAMPKLIRDILHHVHLAELHISAEYGLGDPADTGQLCGLLMPLQYASTWPSSVSLDLRPDFTKACLNGSVTAAVRVTVAALFVPISRFVWRAYGPHR